MKKKIFTLKWLILFLAISFMSGCYMKVGYNNADLILLWVLDDYFDLTKEQRSVLDSKIKNHLLWHRKDELPAYANFLNQVSDKARDGLTLQEIDWTYQNYDVLYEKLIGRLSSDAAIFLSNLNEEQIQYLEKKINEENEEFVKKYSDVTPEKRREKRAERTVDFVKDLLGDITPEQEKKIIELSKSLPDNNSRWMEERKRRQKLFLELLHSKITVKEMETRLKVLVLEPEKGRPVEYQKQINLMVLKTKEMVLAIDQMATPEQRSHAIEEIQKLINDIREIMAS